MTQPTTDAGFGVRPDAHLEPGRRAPFRLPYDDVVSFAERRLRDEAPELTVDLFARIDSALNDRASWCWLSSDVAQLARDSIAAQHFAHGIGPAAHEAVDAPYSRQCAYVYRLGLWLTERRFGEGYVACLLRHEAAPDRGFAPVGLAAELVDFREQRRLLSEPAPLGAKADDVVESVTTCPRCSKGVMSTSGGRHPLRCVRASCRYEPENERLADPPQTPVGAYLPPHIARSVLLTDRDVCGWQRVSDDAPCPKDPGHDEPHRCRSPYGDSRWIDYDAASGLEVARSLAWTAELRQVDGPLEPMQVRDGDRAWIRGVLAHGRPEVVWVRVDNAAEVTGRWVDVIAAAGDVDGSTLEAYAANKGAEKGQDWEVVDSTSDPAAVRDSRYVLRPKPGGAELLAPLPAGVRRGEAGEPYHYVVDGVLSVDPADPGLEGQPAAKPLRGLALEVAQAIGSHPEVQRDYGPGDNLAELGEVIRVALVHGLGEGATTTGDLHRALALLGTVETVKATKTPAEIAGVRLEPCDEYGRTRSDSIAVPSTPAGRAVEAALAEQVNAGVGFDPQAIADALFDAVDGRLWLEERPWLEPFLRFVEADDDALLDFNGRTAPTRLQRILEAAYGDGMAHLRSYELDRGLSAALPRSRPDAGVKDSAEGDVAAIREVVDAPAAVFDPAAVAVARELAHQLGRPRDEQGVRHFDAPALARAALEGAGVARREGSRRMLEADGQVIRTRDGEEAIAMCSARSWAQLLVDAWHTFPLAATDPEVPAFSSGAATASDGGTVPADVGWTPPLTADNARELQARGIDIVGAPITSALCICGHERAMHNEVPRLRQPLGCAVLSDVPHHDCPSFLAAVPEGSDEEINRQFAVRVVADVARQLGTDPAPMLDRLDVLLSDEEPAGEPHNGTGPPPGFNDDGHRADCEDVRGGCDCGSALLAALAQDGVIYGQAMLLRVLAAFSARTLSEAVTASLEGGWEPSPASKARLAELGIKPELLS